MKPAPLSVAALTNRIRLRLEEHFADVRVIGEITDFVRAASGHLYFKLKDNEAAIRCVLWRSTAARLKFEPRAGLQVVAVGQIGIYEQRGEYQFQVEGLQPVGVGAAELALRELKEKLLRQGYFAPERKRPLPKFPRRLGVIASAGGAAVRDMLELLTTRWPLAEVIVRPSRVQGEGAAAEVAAAIHLLSHLHITKRLRFDAVVVGRGGGSTEDLAAFNEEVVADAIFHAAMPIVSAVGHETDVTIADLVADYRALTPSQAIAAVCPDRTELAKGLIDRAGRLQEAIAHRMVLARQRVDRCADRPALRRPLERIHDREQKLDEIAGRLQRAVTRTVARQRERVAAVAGHLESLSPLHVLGRGYSLTRTLSGQVIHEADQVAVGDTLITRVSRGEIVSTVIAPPPAPDSAR